MQTIPFAPGPTVSLAVTGSSGTVTLSLTGMPQQVVVTSPATNAIAFIKFGTSSVTAAVTDFPILPGTAQTLSIGDSATTVAAIGTASTTLYFTVGQGQ